ncbi:hypothetical protein ACJW31_03G139100 [Castanea mollissima]
MDKYLIRKPCTQDLPHTQNLSPVQDSSSSSKRIRVNFNLENLLSDPGLQEKISSYHPNNHDEIRRYYLQKGLRYRLEYSIDKDAIFCFYCYLFGQDVGKQGGGDTFVMKGFKLWNQKEKLNAHVRGIQSVLVKQSNQDKTEYQVQLNAIVDCIRFLLCRGLAFRGHDESQCSSDKGNFLELLQFLGDHNESINEVLQKALKNCKLTHHDIQKDIVNAIARGTSKAIIKDLDNGFFLILVDGSRDISVIEQMALVLRYFLGIVHVASTTALSLKYAIECLLCEHNLSLSKLHGQGYDGTSNIKCDINGLKTIILKENQSSFYVHYFAHQLQLTLVAIAKITLTLQKKIYLGSYYKIILNLILMFSAVVDVLEIIEEDGLSDQKVEARSIIRLIQSFKFVFALHLMKNILGITNELSIALEKKNHDIVNTMDLVKVSKQQLQVMRDDEWIFLLTEVSSFCTTHDIPILNMDEIFVVSGRPQRNTQQNTNLYHYHVELFYTVIDIQLQELNNRFSEVNTDLLLCMACLNPSNSFVAFDKEKLICLANFKELVNLLKKLVNTEKHETYPLVYLLLKLALTLPVATATVERSFSTMKYIKNELCNRMGDQWINDCLVVYIEKDIACSIDNETIM